MELLICVCNSLATEYNWLPFTASVEVAESSPGATGSVVDPQSYTKLTSANGARGGPYTNEQLRAIDYIIYHGATASQEKDV